MTQPMNLARLVAACVLGAGSPFCLAALSTPNHESFESIQVTSGQTGTVNAASAIHVRSNGSEYTEAVGSHVTYLIGGSAKVSANKWRVFNVQLGIGALAVMNDGTRLNALGNGHFENFGSFYSAGVNQYATKHYTIKDHPVQVPLGTSGLGHFAVQRCNANKKGLQQQGVSNIAIFNRSRTITIPVAFHFAAQVNDKDKGQGYDATGAREHGAAAIGVGERYWRQATLWQSVLVVCEKAPALSLVAPQDPTPVPTGPNNIALARGVTHTFLSLGVNNQPAGNCGVKLSGVIQTNLPNTHVTFVYRNHKGVETPARTIKTDHASTAMFLDVVDFSKGQSDGPTLTSPVATPAPGNAGTTFAPQPSSKQYHGWYQIVGKNFNFKSNLAEYGFDCKTKPPGSIQAPSQGPFHPQVQPGAGALSAIPRPTVPGTRPIRAVPQGAAMAPPTPPAAGAPTLQGMAGARPTAQGQGGSSCYPAAGPTCVSTLQKACDARRGGMRSNADRSVTCVVNRP